MLLHVPHETAYDYAPSVRSTQHMAHLKPAHNARQQLLSHKLTIDPLPAQQMETVDVYGNTRAFFSLQVMHDGLRVQSESLVATSALPPPESSIAWDEVRERMRYHRGSRYDPAAEFGFA